jgi:hypothetical protein
MRMASKWVEQGGKKIVVMDYRGSKNTAQMVAVLEEGLRLLAASPVPVVVLSNFEGVAVQSDFMARIKQAGKDHGPKIQRSVSVGIDGLKGILVKGYAAFTGQKVTVCSSEAEGLREAAK